MSHCINHDNYLIMRNEETREIKLTSVRFHCERASSCRLPHVLLIIVVLGDDRHFVSHEIGRVETHTKLTNHRDVSSSLESLHESLGSGLGNGTQIVDQISFGHADTGIDDGQGAGMQVGLEFNLQLFAGLKSAGVCQAFVSDFVQGLCSEGYTC